MERVILHEGKHSKEFMNSKFDIPEANTKKDMIVTREKEKGA